MKKMLAMALIASMLALPGLALADDNGSGSGGSSAANPGDLSAVSLPAGQDVPVVGEDIVIGEGEFKIVSVEQDSPDAPVVGEDVEIGENEAKILSAADEDTPAAGEGVEMSEEEAKIVSAQSGLAGEENAADTQQAANGNTLLFAGIGAGAAALAAAGIVLSKKRKKMSK